ncbi:MAG TPA: hypothetical protein VE397_02705 [Stellaceae bacterium]|nr:hypothetical protein [Stellaceae bacterium]
MSPPRKVPPPPVPPPRLPAVAQPRAGGYQITVGSYLHRGPGAQNLPPDLAGHSFVAIQEPSGRRQAFGFSPAQYQRYDPRRDLPKLTAGVKGRVHSDDTAFAKPGLRTRSFEVSAEQARAALAKVAEYQTRTPDFSLTRRQCSTFTGDVLRAAKIDAFPGAGVRRPQQVYAQLGQPAPKLPRR